MQGYNKVSSKASSQSSTRSLVLILTIAFGVAFVGSLITEPALTSWYTNLDKPYFTPDGWVFGAAWSFVYSSMAVAFWRIWEKRSSCDIQVSTVLYHLQLCLNLAWTACFFGMHNTGLAFAELLILQLANIATAISFYKIDKLSGFIFIPYIWWVSFAAVLNFYIWIAN